MKETDNKERLG